METPQLWDERLRKQIAYLRTGVAADEKAGEDFMRLDGASETTIDYVAARARLRGSRIRGDPATGLLDKALGWAEAVLENCKQFSFRLDINPPQLFGPGLLPMRVITEQGEYWLDTSRLENEDKRLFVEHVALLIPFNVLAGVLTGSLLSPDVYYPSPDLMTAVRRLFAAHDQQELLADRWKSDDETDTLLREFLGSDEYKRSRQGVRQERGEPTRGLTPTKMTRDQQMALLRKYVKGPPSLPPSEWKRRVDMTERTYTAWAVREPWGITSVAFLREPDGEYTVWTGRVVWRGPVRLARDSGVFLARWLAQSDKRSDSTAPLETPRHATVTHKTIWLGDSGMEVGLRVHRLEDGGFEMSPGWAGLARGWAQIGREDAGKLVGWLMSPLGSVEP